jgi:glycosyltransferase involved in cell wall biosynthesis
MIDGNIILNKEIKLSSIVIACDEEKNILRCLESQINVVDDIVVLVDSRSTDLTYKYAISCKNTNCEIIEWKGYATTKTYALTKTKYDWVLWIDADEELTPQLISELDEFKSTKPLFNVYDLARRAFFLGKWIRHSGWYPARVERLFNKKYVLFNNKNVHEGLIYEGERGHLKYDLNHYTDPCIEHYFLKFNKYTSLAAEELFNIGKKSKIKDIALRPIFLFIKMYIFRLGFLDGFHGFILSVFSSGYVFTKYCKLWELNRRK